MSLDGNRALWRDPQLLIKEAQSLREADQTPAPEDQASVVEAIRRAHELVSPDLYVIERLKDAGVEPDHRRLFGKQLPEKTAALIFLTKQKLLDIEQCQRDSRDIEDARKDLISYVETLFHLEAVDAFGIFYDFASTRQDSPTPKLWENVHDRSLYLMACLPQSRPKVLSFLKGRPHALRRLVALLESMRKDISEMLRLLVAEYQKLEASGAPLPDEAPMPYVTLYREYEHRASGQSASGLSSLLTAQDRIRQALAAGDNPLLASWIAEGSPAAMRTAFDQVTMVLSAARYVDLMGMILSHEGLDPVRAAVVAMELGRVDRASNETGGAAEVNKLLREMTLTDNEDMTGAARVAVQQLASVGAYIDLRDVVTRAPWDAVAEEALLALKQLRRLPSLESIQRERPTLAPAVQAARQELQELQSLVESARACPSEELAQVYVDRLKALEAEHELLQLAMKETGVSEIAQRALRELRQAAMGGRQPALQSPGEGEAPAAEKDDPAAASAAQSAP